MPPQSKYRVFISYSHDDQPLFGAVRAELLNEALNPWSEHPPDLMLAVGDWFLAESSAGRPIRGVIQTVFVAHGPMVTSRIAEFDRKLDGLIAVQGSPAGQSKQWSISKMREIMQPLPESPFLLEHFRSPGA